MRARKEQTNKLWWMAAVVLLLFVAIAVMPVAADPQWPSNNDTFIIPTNGMRTHGDNVAPNTNHDFHYNATDGYYFWMVNGTQGMNAIHITNDPSLPNGQLTNSTDKSGTFYVSSTGGHSGDDNAILLIGINTTNQTDINQFAINLNASGYNWDPLPQAYAPTWTGDPYTYDEHYYNASTLSGSFTAANFLKNSSGNNITQRWKFAPLNNYPMYGGQDMTVDKPFYLILVDLNAGAISTHWGNYNDLNYPGMVRVDYEITSNPVSPMNVTFNTYVYNWDASQAKKTIHWINALSGSPQSGYQVIL